MKLDDKRNPAYWRAMKPDSTLVITDEQALEENPEGESYIVKKILAIKEMSDICEWLFFQLEGCGESTDVWLLVKIVDQELDIRVYGELDDSFSTGNREDMFDSNQVWVFQEPEDPDDFEFSDLEYASCVEWDFSDDEHVDYNAKAGEMQGLVSIDPKASGQSDLVATVVEYDTSSQTDSPELLFLEVGRSDVEEGGLIRMMFGNPLSPADIDVLAVTV